MKKSEIEIKNRKIPLLYKFNDELPLVIFIAKFKVAGEISSSKAGLAGIVADLMNEGSKTLGVSAFARKLEVKAIELEASNDFETFSLTISCLKEYFPYALSLLNELLKDLNFTEESLEKIKKQKISTLLALESDFDYLAKEKLKELLHPESQLAQPSLGTLASLESITLEDVKNFYKENLNLANLFLVLAGDVEEKEVNFAQLFSTLEVGEKRELKKIPTSDKEEFFIKKEESEQAYIYFGSPFYLEEEEKYKANVAMFILGSSGFGSRLMEEIRVKKGLAYSIYGNASLKLSKTLFEGYMQTQNENREAAIQAIKKEIEKFLEFGAKEEELEQAKKFLIGCDPLRKERFMQRISIAVAEYYSGHDFGYQDEQLQKIEKLKLEELNSFIKKHKEIGKLSFSIVEK